MRACVRAYVLACMRVGSFHHGELEDKEFQLLQGALLKSRKKLHFQLPTSAADRFRRGGPHETLSHIPVRRVHMHMEERKLGNKRNFGQRLGQCVVSNKNMLWLFSTSGDFHTFVLNAALLAFYESNIGLEVQMEMHLEKRMHDWETFPEMLKKKLEL